MMKKFNILLVLILSLTITSCKDSITEDSQAEGQVVIQPPVNPSPNDQISSIKFPGVEAITDIKQRGFKVSWTPITGAGSYQIFFVTKTGLELQHTVNHPQKSYTFKNLTADTEYKIIVRLMDIEGRIDINENIQTVRTNSWSDYHNNYSVHFYGSSGVLLEKASDILGTKNFTISFWFKTNVSNENKYLFSFHKDFSAQLALAAVTKNDSIGVVYTNTNDETKELVTTFNYQDNKWHHFAVTYNQSWIAIYIDGQRLKKAQDQIIAFGDRPAAIGYSDWSNGFIGQLDEASIWHTALGRKGISDIYHNGSSFDLNRHSAFHTLKHWYRMGDHNNDNDAHIEDHIGNAHGSPNGVRPVDFRQDAP